MLYMLTSRQELPIRETEKKVWKRNPVSVVASTIKEITKDISFMGWLLAFEILWTGLASAFVHLPFLWYVIVIVTVVFPPEIQMKADTTKE